MSATGAAHFALALPRLTKRAIAMTLDTLFCVLSVLLAFYIRLDQWVLLEGLQWLAVVISLALALPIFAVSGLYRAIFRYSGSAAMITIAQAAMVYGVLYATIITFGRIDTIPRTVGLIQPVVLFLLVASSRVLVGWWLGGRYAELLGRGDRRPVLIYGAGLAGRQLAMGLASSEMYVVGFADDDASLHGRVLMGRLVYPPTQLEDVIAAEEITDVLLALPSASRQRRNEILGLIRPLGVAVRTIPGLSDVAHGRVETSDIRELDVEDLLRRDAVTPDERLLQRNVAGHVVMISGAGGSIGSELCRQVLTAGPATLLLVEMSEPALYAIHQELAARVTREGLAVSIVPLLASVCDRERIASILGSWQPQTVYHAAAYKHVPLVEHNPTAGIMNNVFGTMTMALLALEHGVDTFVFVSTDKAVRPTNVMGASKRLAEQVLQAIAATSATTCFAMVRFGNVLGSSGSVVPMFRRQIRAGGPVTVTHPDITRYFMTIPEASQLVIQAGAMAQGGEVFVLDMGEPVRIVDLALSMIELSGLTAIDDATGEGDIALSFIGLRPGEKLYEELLIGNSPEPTSHKRICKANEPFMAWPELRTHLAAMQRHIEQHDVPAIVGLLKTLVVEYQPEGQLADFVHIQRQENPQCETDLPVASLRAAKRARSAGA